MGLTLIRHALAALAHASRLSGIRGPYVFQGAPSSPRAAELTENEAERVLLLRRAASGPSSDVRRAPRPR